MKIINIAGSAILSILPRFLPGDFNLITLTLYNELTKEVSSVNLANKELVGDYLELTFDNSTRKEGERYSFTVYNSTDIIYKGKLMVTDKSLEEIQDYEITQITNKKLKI